MFIITRTKKCIRIAVVEKYEFLAAIDSRTSPQCREHNGATYLLKDAKVGTNYPPLHPNCRSTVIPVLE